MLYVIVGGEGKARLLARRKIWKGQMEELDSDVITPEEFAALAGTPTLTGEKRAFFVRNGFSTAEKIETFLDIAKGFALSTHTFVFEEEKLLTKPKEALKKAGAEIQILDTDKKESFNVFGLTNDLARGDRKKLWISLTEAFRQGVSPENIAGVLSWKARTILATAKTPAERARWKKISRELVCLYHDSHRGAGDLELLLERFALTV